MRPSSGRNSQHLRTRKLQRTWPSTLATLLNVASQVGAAEPRMQPRPVDPSLFAKRMCDGAIAAQYVKNTVTGVCSVRGGLGAPQASTPSKRQFPRLVTSAKWAPQPIIARPSMTTARSNTSPIAEKKSIGQLNSSSITSFKNSITASRDRCRYKELLALGIPDRRDEAGPGRRRAKAPGDTLYWVASSRTRFVAERWCVAEPRDRRAHSVRRGRLDGSVTLRRWIDAAARRQRN